MREEVALKINLPESRVQVTNKAFYILLNVWKNPKTQTLGQRFTLDTNDLLKI